MRLGRQRTAGWSAPGSPALKEIGSPEGVTFWRAEGSLVNLTAVRPVAFFTWNAQRFSERWQRRGGMALLALIRPLLYSINRVMATRVLHTLLRGVSQDRLDLLGEEYFQYRLLPRLKPKGVAELREALRQGERIVLVSQGLDHVMRPLARHLGVELLLANRLEFRDGLATGRLETPVIRPRQILARIIGRKPNGRVKPATLVRNLGYQGRESLLWAGIEPAERRAPFLQLPQILFDSQRALDPLPMGQTYRGKSLMLIGFTGFIGKVWVAKVLDHLPEIDKIYLLIRRQRSTSGQARFDKILRDSPLFDPLHEKLGERFDAWVAQKIEVIEGDISQPSLGIAEEKLAELRERLDLIVNSSGLTDFNPDLRQALSINVDGTLHLLEFQRSCVRAAVLHLSTCYVVGHRDGRIAEGLTPNYTPHQVREFDAEVEYESLRAVVRSIEARAESAEVTAELRAYLASRGRRGSEGEQEAQVRKQRQRWIKQELTEAGLRRARQLGWPNTYTLTKSLAESLIVSRGAGLPLAVVRPSIVETSTHDPFRGWNEGVNTSAPISYLLGTFFRQMPTNRNKCLDIIPVDLVVRGMVLIGAALLARRHEPCYQLATSATNPCNMRRTIELTGLAHRKYYRSHEDLNQRLLAYFDTIPVSKERYLNLSAPRQKQVVQALQRILSPLPMARSPLVRVERDLDRVAKIIELYEPFILHNEYVFEAQNVEIHSAMLPAEERAVFGYDSSGIDWWEYWINIHIPALRKWSYPLIEGRPVENKSTRRLGQISHQTATG
ncbi:MAG: SDR family oxidoreductase [Blastocatellia bacterium]